MSKIIDFTGSNKFQGKKSFNGRSLHEILDKDFF
jgi:hypothetical protein